MSNQLIPGEKDVKTVLEVHGLLPEGLMQEEFIPNTHKHNFELPAER